MANIQLDESRDMGWQNHGKRILSGIFRFIPGYLSAEGGLEKGF